MSATNYLLTEEHLSCCICLDVFIDPVTLPCGHNFCKNCITEHLKFNPQCQCPMCKERVDKKYKLGVNTFISEMAIQFRKSAGKTAVNNSKQHTIETGQVTNDVLTRVKAKTMKSCVWLALGLVFLTICFAANIKIHQTVSSLITGKLFDPVENVAGRMCTKHGRPLELYCKNEQKPICRSCAESVHRFHQVVPLEEEYEAKKTELRKTEADIQHKILERQLESDAIKYWIKLNKEIADRDMADGVQVFTALIQSLEKVQANLIEMIEEKREATEKQAESFIPKLEQEISELMRRKAELEQLSRTEDHMRFLQSFSSLNAAPLAKDLTEISICPVVYNSITRTALVSAVEQLTEIVKKEMSKLQEAELKSAQQNAVEVTLDPDTAHPALILSDDGKQVHCGDAWNKLPDNSEQFEPTINVLGKQSFSCGRRFYDVQVTGKTGWALGVAKESVSRKGAVQLNPVNGYWTICLRNGKYFALASRPVTLSVNNHPEKVRVFVDYDEGVVSFYDVGGAALLYSFTGCSFTEKIYPFFSPGTSDNGRNSAPLIISPVNQ